MNPNPPKKAPKRNISLEEWDQHKEDRVDRLKKEKDRIMAQQWLIIRHILVIMRKFILLCNEYNIIAN